MKFPGGVWCRCADGRPPRGGRGLKYVVVMADGGEVGVAPLAGGVD